MAGLGWGALALAQSPPVASGVSSLAAGSGIVDAGVAGLDAGVMEHDAGAGPLSSLDRKALRAGRLMVSSLAKDAGAAGPVSVVVPYELRIAPRTSVLGVPVPPPSPKARTRFSVPDLDPAYQPARALAERVASFPNLRALVPGAVWHVAESARFAIRDEAACLSQLSRVGVRAQLLARELSTPVPVPLSIDAPVNGVAFVSLHADRAVEVSCELAARLAPLARLLRRHGVLAVGINSSYRAEPKISFHTFGLALDVMAFRTEQQTLIVADHFEVTPDVHTCEATPNSAEGKALLAIVCAIADSGLFSSVLTPNYNEGHKDHVHLDLRPDDPRRFLR